METASYMWTIVTIGLVTVFLSLIALVLMVGFFKFLFVKSSRAAPSAGENQVHASPLQPVAKAVGIDGAVIAAIMAAISAASGASASSFRIASIERTGFNTPVWGHVDRA